ncbi:sugar ABC transporter permease [Streptomyces sp. DT2A-34]|uniref:carbohydrate ABC transporter permease n=1 Tax=Streptomyces sp. DT2A-34 TaxID=3051182 RepID=UPI00265B9272|nr:sugar ABC transporter permease [Streptomyces sp. DT2A-34]MDO0917199.1 sugar ABC transporter permease [Streptomyces sp. DT2A-34]
MATISKPASTAVPKTGTSSKRRRREALWFYLFVSPWMIGFLVFLFGPMIASVYYSMTDWDSFTEPVWVGFQNYVTLITDDARFWRALWHTFYYAVVSVPLGLVLGLCWRICSTSRYAPGNYCAR